MSTRFVFYHKQATSARMRFMVYSSGSVVSGEPLGDLITLQDREDDPYSDVEVLPSSGLAPVLEALGMSGSSGSVNAPDIAVIETPGGDIQVHGVKFNDIDPPFDAVEAAGGKFIEMTGVRVLDPTDMEIVRRIYVQEMGG